MLTQKDVNVSHMTVSSICPVLAIPKAYQWLCQCSLEFIKKNEYVGKTASNDNWEKTLFSDETAFQLFRKLALAHMGSLEIKLYTISNYYYLETY